MKAQPERSNYDTFLDTLTRQLILAPRDLQNQYREEARQHLELLAQARIESGDSPEKAAAKAMAAFGDPKAVGRGIADEIGWGTGLMQGSLAIAVISGIVWLCLLTIIAAALMNVLISVMQDPTSVMYHPAARLWWMVMHWWAHVLNVEDLVLVPCCAGVLTGLLAPKSAANGMIVAAIVVGAFRIVSVLPYYPNLYPSYWGYIRLLLAQSAALAGFGYLAAAYISLRLRGLKRNASVLFDLSIFKEGSR